MAATDGDRVSIVAERRRRKPEKAKETTRFEQGKFNQKTKKKKKPKTKKNFCLFLNSRIFQNDNNDNRNHGETTPGKPTPQTPLNPT